jgi:hypothetical protein
MAAICSDEHNNKLPSETIGDWLQQKCSYEFLNPKEALDYFISDIEARNPSIIYIDCSFVYDTYIYICKFQQTTNSFTTNVCGFTDDERNNLTVDTIMTDEYHNAIIASSCRHREKNSN